MVDFFWTTIWPWIIWEPVLKAIQSLAFLVPLLIILAYIIYADRKIWAAVQLRRGPNVVGPWGIMQSFADMLKFLLKEPTIPSASNRILFVIAPLITGFLALAVWAVVPVGSGWPASEGTPWVVANINVGVLYILAISSLEVYGIIIGGWASNSKYPFLSALRSAGQMISYEVSIGFVIITVVMCAGSLNLVDIVNAQKIGVAGRLGVPWAGFLNWYWVPLFPMFIIFFISALAETNRPPFDLPEAESELVAGFMVEYGSVLYMLFMLGEYLAICLMSVMTAVLFMGGWLPAIDLPIFAWVPGVIWLLAKAFLVFFMFAMVKAFVPRYRYDQLMRLGWKVFLPLSLFMVVAVASVLHFFNLAP